LHKREIEGKVEEIEENRGLNNKNTYEDQFTTFCQFSFGSLFIISYYSTLIALLEHSSIGESKQRKDKGSKGQARKVGSNGFNKKTYR